MTRESLPSKNVNLIDVPDVEKFLCEFQYNYWTADEFENGLGSSNAAFNQIPSETFDASFVSRTKKLPRLIKLSWKPVNLNQRLNHDNQKISIRSNLEKIHSEESFTSNDYVSLRFQDNEADLKLKFFMDQFVGLLTGSANAKSSMEVSQFVMDNTPDAITSTFLTEIIANLQDTKGTVFTNKSALQIGKGVETSLLEKIKLVSLNTKINNRLILPLLSSVQRDSLGVFSEEFSDIKFIREMNSIQNNAISQAGANLLNSLDYEFEILSYLDYRPIDSTGYEPRIEPLGYVIEKREIKIDGSEEKYPPIIVENPQTGVVYDGQIRYGTEYFYKAKAIYLVEVSAIDTRKKQNFLVSFLVSSKYSQENAISTFEMVPPPPPNDFNVAWDYGERALRCTWNLPTNSQQDIKYIQLFRRNNINEPFQLIKMWDFNDTHTKVPLNEYPQKELIEQTNSFVGFYIDREFNKDSDFIYAVCSTDAHSLTSNYSLQFQVKFDKFTNKLIKKLVSISGAPKQYPNAFLNSDTFVDTIKDSGHTTINVIFNPEYMKLVDSAGSDLGLLKTDRVDGKYRLQMINVDLQSQKNLDITLNDFRITLQENIPTNLASKVKDITSKINTSKINKIR